MTLEEQLRHLTRQRRLELCAATRDYTRLKRQANPDRFLRRHMGPALLTAALLGLILAPGPRHAHRAPRGGFRALVRALQWTLTQLRPPHPAPTPTPEPAPAAPDRIAPEAPRVPASLLDLLPTLIGQLDWEAIVRALITGLQNRHAKDATEQSPADPPPGPNGHPASPPASPPDSPTTPIESPDL